MPYDELIDNARAFPAAPGETRGKDIILVGLKLFLTNFENMKRTNPKIYRSIKTPLANLHIRLRRYLLLTLIVSFL